MHMRHAFLESRLEMGERNNERIDVQSSEGVGLDSNG